MDSLDIDPNFEPQTRARSNTWPQPRPENYVDKDGDDKLGVPATIQEQQSPTEASQAPKKNSSRRNAWGNMSYADLITQAIQSSPEKRLTLSQIYDWMVQNVPYFKDKGDSNSSAGWKNSIRHNLSLHNRFMRVQNEGTGKSSWWMINPDAKPGKAARRRAGSMETTKYEKKRGRVKKKVEALRNGLDTTPSPSSSVSEGLDMFPESPVHHSFQLSPDFRPRTSSNASTCSRLSPIPAVESDMHDSQVPPLSPIPWTSELPPYHGSTNGGLDSYGTDQLGDSLAERMKLGENGFLAELKGSPTGQLSPAVGQSYRMSGGGSPYYRGNGEYRYQSPTTESGNTLTPLGTPVQSHSPLLEQPNMGNGPYLSPQHSVSPAYGAAPLHGYSSPLQHDTFRTEGGGVAATFGSSATQNMWSVLSLNNPLPNDLDLNTLQGGLDCDVDQVIKHELTLDPNLDFNFDNMNGATANVPHPTTKNTVVSRPWVH